MKKRGEGKREVDASYWANAGKNSKETEQFLRVQYDAIKHELIELGFEK